MKKYEIEINLSEIRFLEVLERFAYLRYRWIEIRDNDYIQDPETGKMQGSRPSGSSSKSVGKSDESIEKSEKSDTIKEKGKAIKNAFRAGKTSSDIVSAVIDNHEGLADYTPESMKSTLEELGYEVKPLGGKSSLKGIPFENGGGYRVTFSGDGYFQYHPAKNSHHGEAYWKVVNGSLGVHRYEMDGKPKK